MRAEEKANVKNSVGRLMLAGISLLIQIGWIVFLLIKVNEYSTVISMGSSLLAVFLALQIYGTDSNAAFKMPWIILILAFPVLGLCIYGLFGTPSATKKMRERYNHIDAELKGYLLQNEDMIHKLEKEDYTVANEARYIADFGPYPIYQDTDIQFYADAAAGFEAQLQDIEKARHFIFMEYHAIEEAEAFWRLRDALAKKAAEGVEVRLFYDDVGSIGFINTDFIKRMQALGINCRVFNPVMVVFNIFMNNRDHRKITVIDGKVGFTGGYNLANEYFNLTHPYGHWKDTGVRIEGEAVRNMTLMFLEMWNAMKKTDTDIAQYLPKYLYTAKEEGYVQPYADRPLDREYLAENVYLNQIKSANHRFYVTTPYLIISDEMNRELCLAAKRGVDVRIVTPGIPDKKLVYKITRSYYARLVQQGVRIYEYTPGFMHAKQTVCDGKTAIVGTINFDYRSLYHHFENGVFIFKHSVIEDIEKDFENIFAASEEVTQKYKNTNKKALRLGRNILRLFAPLL